MPANHSGEELQRISKHGKWVLLFALLAVFTILWAWIFPALAPLRPLDQQLVDAVNRDDTAAVRALLVHGADPNTRSVPTDLWQLPLSTAMQRVWLRVSRPDSRREPVLVVAAERDDVEIVTALLNNRAKPDLLDADGFTPLMRAVAPWPPNRPITPTVDALLAHGAQVNVTTQQGMTALIYASGNGSIPVVKLLLKKGADVNVRNSDGNTALKFARRHPVVAALLAVLGRHFEPPILHSPHLAPNFSLASGVLSASPTPTCRVQWETVSPR